MRKLRVRFGDPHAGWFPVEIVAGPVSIAFRASYVYASIYNLIAALRLLLAGQGESIVTWTSEPVEYEMRFLRDNDTITLTILEYPDSRRLLNGGQVLLNISGTYAEVALPLWRAVRGVQGRWSLTEWREHYHSPFPSDEMEKLTGEMIVGELMQKDSVFGRKG